MLEEPALQILRGVSPHGKPLENHCRRLADFTMLLSKHTGIEMDPDLVMASCYLHDIGLLVDDPEERNYLKRGLRYSRPKMQDLGLGGSALRVFDDIMLYNHSIREVPGITPQGELVRKAVHVEHSLGQMRSGLTRAEIREVLARHPRRGFNRVLAAFFKTAIIDDGVPELVRVFLPGSVTDAA